MPFQGSNHSIVKTDTCQGQKGCVTECMRSNYKKLGEYIRVVDRKNIEDKQENLLGVTTNKVFIPSVANTIGTDFTKYQIVKRHQFTYVPDTGRRGDRIGIALLQDREEALVSSAYIVFEIIDHDQLLPEYVMMWFRRPEFDRYARFKSHGSVREIFGWEEMCNVELPVPDIATQHAIVNEYNTIVNRIALNERLNQKLEETAQALYTHWFVNFEFPDENGNPYKSSGGEMVESELGEIPKGWREGFLSDIIDLIDGDRGKNYPSQDDMFDDGYCLFLDAGNVTKNGFAFSNNTFISKEKDTNLRKGKLKRYDVVLTTRGTVGNVAFYGKHVEYDHIRINSGMIILRGKKHDAHSLFVYFLMKSDYMKVSIKNYLSGSAQPQLPIKDIVKIPILIPDKAQLDDFVNIIVAIQNQIDLIKKQNRLLNNLLDVLLSKLAILKDSSL